MDLESLINDEEQKLLQLRNRFLWLRAIEKELERRLGKYRFEIENDLIWMTVLDSRDALFIHFASWAKSLVQDGGFFGKLRAHHLNKFYVPRSKKTADKLAAIRDKSRRDRFEELFPEAAARGKMQAPDIDAVKNRFYAAARQVIDDRDVYRAHPFERKSKGDIKLLRLDEFEPALEAAQETLNGLRLCALNSTYGYHDHPSLAGASDTAIDVIDLVFFHSLQNMIQRSGANDELKAATGRWWWEHLEAWRERLSRAHARLAAADETVPVNADAVLDAASGES